MDLTKFSKIELLNKCNELNIKNCKSKNKSQLIELINKNLILTNDNIEIAIKNKDTNKSLSTKLKMIDLFAGTGAFTLAFENSGNVECVFANDIDKSSKVIYDENFIHKLTLKDLNEINPNEIPKHDILTGGFPCFIEGTQTLTNSGYKNIEDVKIIDKLLSHTGKFQNILNLQKKIYTGDLFDIKIKYHQELITATEEHPFYIREKKGNNIFGNPIWKKANKLNMNDYFGMIINNNEIIPELTFDKIINEYKTEQQNIKLDLPDYWFVVGYLVRNSSIEEPSIEEDGQIMYKIQFTISSKDDENVFNRINKIIRIIDTKCDSNDKCKKFECSNFILYNILKQFGKYAHTKIIPEWVQDSPKEFIQEFIKGYMTADGCINSKILQIATVSSNLAYGLQRLYLKLGHIFSINKCVHPKTTIIEGGIVNQIHTYFIRGMLKRERKISSFIEDNYVWFAPYKIAKRYTTEIPVYNFEVENDNSYIVTNTIVHNCQPFSIAGKQEGFDDNRSNVFWKILEIMDYHKPNYVILENVKNLVSHDDKKTFEIIKKELTDRGYFITYKILNTSDITGIPQNRERIYIVCIKSKNIYDKFSLEFDAVNKKQITDMLENDISDKYYYTEKSKTWPLVKQSVIKKNTIYQYRRVYVRENKSSECPTLTANMGEGGHNVPLLLDDKGIRKLTPRECFNFQGFPKDYKLPTSLSDSKLYKLSGNSVTLRIVSFIAERLINLINL